MVLVPLVCDAVDLPVVAAGGIGDGRAMAAAFALGAEAVQVGSRFVASLESSAHPRFKEAVLGAQEGGTTLTLKELAPVRLIKNPFYDKIQKAYAQGADTEALRALLGRGRAKRGMFEGDLTEGELEIGQVSALLRSVPSAAEIVHSMYHEALQRIKELNAKS
jgi:enoyl-[acyl-carrier protein] reductase II